MTGGKPDRLATFLAAVDALQREHDVSISHEDSQGGFLIADSYGKSWIGEAVMMCAQCDRPYAADVPTSLECRCDPAAAAAGAVRYGPLT